MRREGKNIKSQKRKCNECHLEPKCFEGKYIMKYPQLNKTEQVQLTFKVDIHYIWLYLIQVDITDTNSIKQTTKSLQTCIYIYPFIYNWVNEYISIFTQKTMSPQVTIFISNSFQSLLLRISLALLIYSFSLLDLYNWSGHHLLWSSWFE